MFDFKKKTLSLFFTSALVYLSLVSYISYPLTTLLKAIPILCLLALVSRIEFDSNVKKFLLSALSLSILGDIALTLPLRHQLELGLGFFLIAHCFYIAIFFRDLTFNFKKIVTCLLIILSATMIYSSLITLLGDLLIPVSVYITIITTMACFSVLTSAFSVTATVGAMIFMLSDSLIACNEFIVPEYNLTVGIMISYYLAQLLLVIGISGCFDLKTRLKRSCQ
jgi:uncharacterized membrane protein YhhN